MAGVTIRLGLSELGPLNVLINVEIPGGILLEPNTGLTINDFTAGVEFFKTLPSIDDPFALRSPEFGLPTSQSADQWLAGLQQQVALQAKAIAANPALNGFTAAFTAPMTITGSARVYSIYTSQAVFNGQVIVKISTDGKFLIVGKLNFAGDAISISGKLYADLSRVSSGNVTVLFLADVPDQVRLLTVYGKLKMGFRNAAGEEVAFDVAAPPSLPSNSTAPTVTVVDPAPAGGSVDVNAVGGQTTIDVIYTPAPGASLDVASILESGTAFTVTGTGINGATVTVSGRPVPVVTLTLDDGILVVPLTLTGSGDSMSVVRLGPSRETVTELAAGADEAAALAACTGVSGNLGCRVESMNKTVSGAVVTVRVVTKLKTETVATKADLAAGTAVNELNLLTAAVKKTGTNRYRYEIGSVTWKLGIVTVDVAPDAFKNADAMLEDGSTVAGAANAATTI